MIANKKKHGSNKKIIKTGCSNLSRSRSSFITQQQEKKQQQQKQQQQQQEQEQLQHTAARKKQQQQKQQQQQQQAYVVTSVKSCDFEPSSTYIHCCLAWHNLLSAQMSFLSLVMPAEKQIILLRAQIDSTLKKPPLFRAQRMQMAIGQPDLSLE